MVQSKSLCVDCQLLSYDQDRIVEIKAYKGRGKDRYYLIPLQYEFNDEFPTLPRLATSAKNGCSMCSFIRDALQIYFLTNPTLASLTQSESRKRENDPNAAYETLQLVLSEYHPVQTHRWLRDPMKMSPFFILGEIRVCKTTYPVRFEVTDDLTATVQSFPDTKPLTSKSLRMIQDWISICISPGSDEHEKCPKNQKAVGPRRLIDVMSGDTIRLVEADSMNVQYVILSYCWGQSTAMKSARTIESNITQRLNGFAMSQLPQTLRDSITITRALCIPYIWIDAVCIVQDSGEWATEGSRMMTYYENSYLTIVPVVCTSADQSFLGPRPRWVSQRVTGAWADKPEKQLVFSYPQWNHVEMETDRSIWASRGWTFQERLLSTRTLYFGRNGVRFECRGASWVDINPDKVYEGRVTAFLPSSNALVCSSAEWTGVDKIRSMWYQLLTEYIERELTFESDRLLAISGVAQKVGILLDGTDEYIAGFWKNDLCHGLCWTAWKGMPAKPQPRWASERTPLFPSWSWCSMNKPVTWNDWTGAIACAELVDMVESPCLGKNLGTTQCTKLMLTSWVFPADLLESKLPDGLVINIQLDKESDYAVKFKATTALMAIVLLVYLDDCAEEEWTAAPTSTAHEVIGLLLEPTGQYHGKYMEHKRLGFFEVVIDMQVDSILDYSNTTAPFFYERVYASKHTIALI